MSMHFTVNTEKKFHSLLHSAVLFTELEPDCAVMSCQIQAALITITCHDTARALSANPGPPVPFSLDPYTTDVTPM